jgi:dolichyl-phosphate-mannose-protein mannosyltransferase
MDSLSLRGHFPKVAVPLGLLLVVIVASFTRFDGLGTPHTYIADEGFYAPDGCLYVVKSAKTCHRSAEASPEHPPLGKWLIGLGIRLTSYTPTGWRTAPAIAGVLTVALLFFLGLELLGSVVWATFAALLLALDPLHIVQSRIATLDVFVALFGVAAVLLTVLDARRPSARFIPSFRLASGIACGAAVASKWSGIFALGAVLAITLLQRRADLPRRLASVAVAFGVVPLVVYCASFAGRIHGRLIAAPWAHQSPAWRLIHRQFEMWRAQTGAFATSAYQSPPWSWPLLKRPDVHYAAVSHGQIREVLAVGSPIVWWLGLGSFLFATVTAVRSRGRELAPVVVSATIGFTYLPWLLLGQGRSFVFLYYMTPVVPFLCLAAAWGISRLGRASRWVLPAVALTSALLLVFWWPILTANPISYGGWRERVVFHDCRPGDQPEKLPPDRGGQPSGWLQLLHGRSPHGWCWV